MQTLPGECPYRTNLKEIFSQQKHAIRIVFNKERLAHTEELFKENKILNIYHFF